MNIEGILRRLKKLKSLGVVGIKQSLEDEGATFNDIVLMRKLTKKIKLSLNVKIGGCEAKNDINFCKSQKVDSIVAPMVESSYALKKFVQSINTNSIPILINIETNLAIENFSKILKVKEFKKLHGIVIGRSDIAGSLGLEKKYVDSKIIFKMVSKKLNYLKKNLRKKFIIKMGGSITDKSKNFILKLYNAKILNSVETRNIEIKINIKTINNFKVILNEAFLFELEWLNYKLMNFDKTKANSFFLIKDYKKRIREIKKRFNSKLF